MAKTGKRLNKAYEGIDPAATPVKLDEAVKQIKSRASAKFDETVEIAMNLNLDPRKPDQNLRGTVMLPHGTGKTVRVAVFAPATAPRRPRPPAPTSSGRRIWPRRCRPARSTSTAPSPPPT
jgi:ribosomal protein L1